MILPQDARRLGAAWRPSRFVGWSDWNRVGDVLSGTFFRTPAVGMEECTPKKLHHRLTTGVVRRLWGVLVDRI